MWPSIVIRLIDDVFFQLFFFIYLFIFLLLSFCGWVVDAIIRRYLNHHQEMMNEFGRNVGRRNFMDEDRGQRRDAQSVSQSVYEHPIYWELKEVFFFWILLGRSSRTRDKLSLSRAVLLRSVNDERVAQKLLKVSPHFITYQCSRLF